jgi:hypothetical protein
MVDNLTSQVRTIGDRCLAEPTIRIRVNEWSLFMG